jgi:hypothetical protein
MCSGPRLYISDPRSKKKKKEKKRKGEEKKEKKRGREERKEKGKKRKKRKGEGKKEKKGIMAHLLRKGMVKTCNFGNKQLLTRKCRILKEGLTSPVQFPVA